MYLSRDAKTNSTVDNEFIDDMFLGRKCGRGDPAEHDKFFTWCAKGELNEPVNTICEGVKSLFAACSLTATFSGSPIDAKRSLTQKVLRAAETNGTSSSKNNSKVIIIPDLPKTFPKYLSFKHACKKGKAGWFNNTIKNYELGERGEKFVRFCHDEMYNLPPKEEEAPLWPILLIISIIIIVFSVIVALFWRFWLKKRVFGKDNANASGRGGPISSQLSSRPSKSYSLKKRPTSSMKGSSRITKKAAPFFGSAMSGRPTVRV